MSWYLSRLEPKAEYEITKRNVAALQDEAGLTRLLGQTGRGIDTESCVLLFQVDDVVTEYERLLRSSYRAVSWRTRAGPLGSRTASSCPATGNHSSLRGPPRSSARASSKMEWTLSSSDT